MKSWMKIETYGEPNDKSPHLGMVCILAYRKEPLITG